MQLDCGLGPHDALVFASILSALEDLGDCPKVFANKNSKDFATPLVEDHLETHQCRLITTFSDARNYIEAELAKGTH